MVPQLPCNQKYYVAVPTDVKHVGDVGRTADLSDFETLKTFGWRAELIQNCPECNATYLTTQIFVQVYKVFMKKYYMVTHLSNTGSDQEQIEAE
ncbi:hypothetical protein HHI36_003032 [Cryptolaemus montrouzieri]|uniref:Uncharacterized protein n=1 Tax=Cryptolaemus montrouzieri TaxID=559131 RepID=A0ABD2PCQ1_9CUCU